LWPISAKQAAATSPTYPDPITQIDIEFFMLCPYLPYGRSPTPAAAQTIDCSLIFSKSKLRSAEPRFVELVPFYMSSQPFFMNFR
jgi:hypothetical protein